MNFVANADYSAGSMMEKIVETILDKIKLDVQIDDLKKQCRIPK